jgi:hypothetical protein
MLLPFIIIIKMNPNYIILHLCQGSLHFDDAVTENLWVVFFNIVAYFFNILVSSLREAVGGFLFRITIDGIIIIHSRSSSLF